MEQRTTTRRSLVNTRCCLDESVHLCEMTAAVHKHKNDTLLYVCVLPGYKASAVEGEWPVTKALLHKYSLNIN